MRWVVETRKTHSRVWHVVATYDTDMQCHSSRCGLPRAYRTRYRDTVTGEVWEVGGTSKVYRLPATNGPHRPPHATVPPTGHRR